MRHSHLASLAAALGAMGLWAGQAHAADPRTTHTLEVFGDVLATIDRAYVAPPDDPALVTAAIKGMVAALDPHSAYLTPAEFARLQRPADRGSLGLALGRGRDGMRIVAVAPGSVGAQNGLRAGDTIVAIDGKTLRGMTLDEDIAAIEGEPGTTATLSIVRGSPASFDVKMTRQPFSPLKVAGKMRGSIGYIRVPALEEGATEDVRRAISTLSSGASPMKGLVLDLRGCPGGLFSTSAQVAGLFLDAGLIVTEQGRLAADARRFDAHGPDLLHGLAMVVLIDGSTSSGCEVIAAALQDRKRATIVGLPSFGQGLVQTVYPLRGGADGALKITTAYFYRPNGQALQDIGVIPDLLVAPSHAVAEAFARGESPFNEREEPGAPPARSARPPPQVRTVDSPPAGFDAAGDYQLDRAIAALSPG